jgi:hypothetical protein
MYIEKVMEIITVYLYPIPVPRYFKYVRMQSFQYNLLESILLSPNMFAHCFSIWY